MKSYACVRSLGRQGVGTLVASEHESIPLFSSRYCDERATLASPSEDLHAYRDDLLGLASRRDVATVFPTREHDAYLLAKYRDRFERHAAPVVPSLDTLEKAHDRLRLDEEAAAAGVPRPETRLLSDVEDWEAELIVKSRFNLLTGDYVDSCPPDRVAEVKTVRHLEPGVPPDPDELRDEMGHEPIVQEFVPKGEKWMFCALYDRGEPLATYQHREVRGNSWIGGGGVYRVSAHSPALEEVALDLLDHLEWHGLACLEYIRDANTGEWKFLELNPKLWQSLPSTVRANADFPRYYWLQATGRVGEIDPEYDPGVGCHMLYGELSYLRSLRTDESPLVERPSVPGTVRDVVASCLDQPRFDYLHPDDPAVFVGCLGALLRSDGTDGEAEGTRAPRWGSPSERTVPDARLPDDHRSTD